MRRSLYPKPFYVLPVSIGNSSEAQTLYVILAFMSSLIGAKNYLTTHRGTRPALTRTKQSIHQFESAFIRRPIRLCHVFLSIRI